MHACMYVMVARRMLVTLIEAKTHPEIPQKHCAKHTQNGANHEETPIFSDLRIQCFHYTSALSLIIHWLGVSRNKLFHLTRNSHDHSLAIPPSLSAPCPKIRWILRWTRPSIFSGDAPSTTRSKLSCGKLMHPAVDFLTEIHWISLSFSLTNDEIFTRAVGAESLGRAPCSAMLFTHHKQTT